MIMEIKLGNSLSPIVRAKVGAWCDAHLSDDVVVSNWDHFRSFDSGIVVSIVSALLTAIMLLVQERRYQTERMQWSVDKLRFEVEELMVSLGMIDCEVVEIKGYQALKDANSVTSCQVMVRDKRRGELWHIGVSKDSGAFVIDVDQGGAR